MLPFLAHVIWFGKRALPEYARENIAGFARHHPGWEIVIWDDAAIKSLPSLHRVWGTEISRGIACDLLRDEVLYVFGGLHLDTDVTTFRNCENLLDGDFVFGHHNPCAGQGSFNTGIYAARKGDPLVVSHAHETMARISMWQRCGKSITSCDCTFVSGEMTWKPHPRMKTLNYPQVHTGCHKESIDESKIVFLHAFRGEWVRGNVPKTIVIKKDNMSFDTL
jgi:hypothetical protein